MARLQMCAQHVVTIVEQVRRKGQYAVSTGFGGYHDPTDFETLD
jgi:DUF971 family protein